jgi:hypothetical protein
MKLMRPFYRLSGVLLLAVVFLAACQPEKMSQTAVLPVGRAYAEGQVIYFMHTETSDAEIAALLTKMMDSPVLFVPALSDSAESTLANVYVFSNGIEGMGPLGFAPDVFDNPPGTAGYSPLRRLNVVTWADPARARELKSAAEVLAARDSGEVIIEQKQPQVVINMPFVVWDGGKR